jgi:hypothetical protein
MFDRTDRDPGPGWMILKCPFYYQPLSSCSAHLSSNAEMTPAARISTLKQEFVKIREERRQMHDKMREEQQQMQEKLRQMREELTHFVRAIFVMMY